MQRFVTGVIQIRVLQFFLQIQPLACGMVLLLVLRARTDHLLLDWTLLTANHVLCLLSVQVDLLFQWVVHLALDLIQQVHRVLFRLLVLQECTFLVDVVHIAQWDMHVPVVQRILSFALLTSSQWMQTTNQLFHQLKRKTNT